MSNHRQNWSDVRVFLAVVRAGSTLGASKVLGMPQPTVSRRIEALEHDLSLTLFDRDTRGFRPTAAGQELIEDAKAFEAAAEAYFDAAQRIASRAKKVIRIAAVQAAFTASFAQILQEFTAAHPEVKFDFFPSDNYVDMVRGEADVAIRFAAEITEPSLICRKVGKVHVALFASESYAADKVLPKSESDFQGHQFIVFSGAHVPVRINNWLLPRIDESQIAMRCTDIKSLETAVRMGTGIGPLSNNSPFSTNDGLVKCFDLPDEASSTVWLVANPDSYKRSEVRHFMQFLAPHYSKMLRGQDGVGREENA
ncbi:MAG: LysR family transcriptional regulator [Hyphomicrobiales bacterium]